MTMRESGDDAACSTASGASKSVARSVRICFMVYFSHFVVDEVSPIFASPLVEMGLGTSVVEATVWVGFAAFAFVFI